MSKPKIWFRAHAGMNEPRAYAELKTIGEVRKYFNKTHFPEVCKCLQKRFSKLIVEEHQPLSAEWDTVIYVWGEDTPNFQVNDYGQHEGLKIEVDGKVVFNSLKPGGDADELADHDPECEECAKPSPKMKKHRTKKSDRL
jgi:hypothetical protein